MHKYAALTGPALALITMLTLAVSASLTPADARFTPYCGARINGAAGYQMCRHCVQKCGGSNVDPYGYITPSCKPGAFCDHNVIPPDIVACMATCVNASEAIRRKSRQ
jgi:hypothetical protein